MSLLTIGDQFPAYTVCAVAGGDLSHADAENPYDHFVIASSRGRSARWRVIFFWSRDAMPESRSQIAAFANVYDRFVDRDTDILGVSVDNKYAHFYCRTHLECLQLVPFPLLSDFSHVMAAAAGVLNRDGVADRATFIVDSDNEIRYLAVSSSPSECSVDGILQLLDDLQSADLHTGGGRRQSCARLMKGQPSPRSVT